MVADPVSLSDLETQISSLGSKLNDVSTELKELRGSMMIGQATTETLVSDLKALNGEKENFGDAIRVKIATMDAERNTTEGKINQLYDGAQKEFDRLETDLNAVLTAAQQKFEDMNGKIDTVIHEAKVRFDELEGNIKSGAGHSDKKKMSSFLPDKMMVPRKFSEDINEWRKWKEDVSTYFDEGKEGIKLIMDEVARANETITLEVLQRVCLAHPSVVSDI